LLSELFTTFFGICDNDGVKLVNGKIDTTLDERTSVPNIFAIGDCAKDRPELTPVAIQAGLLLARRLYGDSRALMNYSLIPTSVFTPFEYGCVGLSEEDAIKKFGKENVETFLSRYGALEVAASHPKIRREVRSYVFHPPDTDFEGTEEKAVAQPCLAKLVCHRTQDNLVVGYHHVGPNAGEITQGFALGVKLGAKKRDFDDLVGIHPTSAEEFTGLRVTGSSGHDFRKKDGC